MVRESGRELTQHENPDLRKLKGCVNLRKVTLQALHQLYVLRKGM